MLIAKRPGRALSSVMQHPEQMAGTQHLKESKHPLSYLPSSPVTFIYFAFVSL